MRRVVGVGLLVAALASVPALASHTGPPPGATAQCRDGSYSYSAHHSGTCSHHGGVAQWLDGSAGSASTHGATSAAAPSCGVERWAVKTLQDRPLLIPSQRVTLHYLVTRPRPYYLPTTRLPFEHRVFTVTAAVAYGRLEADDDFHIVLFAGPAHMIAESPGGICDAHAIPLRRRQMVTARNRLGPCKKARVTGVAFFDYDHGQTGVAPNAIELHPILAFRCLS